MEYIIGDVHGMAFTLEKLINKIGKQDRDASYVFVGDYCDRGAKSREVVDICLSLQLSGATFLRGNHDDIIDYLLNDHVKTDLEDNRVGEFVSQRESLTRVASWWFQNGLTDTLESYGIKCEEVFYSKSIYNIVMDFRELTPDSHKSFFSSLKMYWENDTHFACHGFMYPDKELPRSMKFMKDDSITNSEILWQRFNPDPDGGIDKSINPPWDKIGVFGHTPVQYYGMVTPIKHNNIRLIDTCAFKGNYLSAYCVETDDFISVAHESKDLESS